MGCAMNEKDSENMTAELSTKENYKTTSAINEADLIILNTCSVREKPVSKLFSRLGTINKQKKHTARIGVCGCTASHLSEEIIKRAPYVDFVLGARNVSKITKAIKQKGFVDVDINYDETTYLFKGFENQTYKRKINISIGCDKSCTFCIVPNTRGTEISIPKELIINEISKAVDSGVVEVLLLGQNVNNYGKTFSNKNIKSSFVQLLRDISKIDKLKRIRFASPHPLHMDDEFIDEFSKNKKICKNIHIPLQSGSTKVLQDMRRGYTKQWFINRCERIKEKLPNVRISTDIIVAFPTETQKDFEDTIDVIKKVQFDQIFNFKYSSRPNTQASFLKTIVTDDIASNRLEQVIQLHKEQIDKKMASTIDKSYEVLFEQKNKNGDFVGFSDNGYQIHSKNTKDILGKIKEVKITNFHRTYLEGLVS